MQLERDIFLFFLFFFSRKKIKFYESTGFNWFSSPTGGGLTESRRRRQNIDVAW